MLKKCSNIKQRLLVVVVHTLSQQPLLHNQLEEVINDMLASVHIHAVSARRHIGQPDDRYNRSFTAIAISLSTISFQTG